MKAVVYHTYGSPDVLNLCECEKPVPGDDELLIKVRAASVNPLDCGELKGIPFIARLIFGLAKPDETHPASPGVDLAKEDRTQIGASFSEGMQAIVFFCGQVIISNMDILLVKHYFDPHQAGLYAAAALGGKMLLYLISRCSVSKSQSRRLGPAAFPNDSYRELTPIESFTASPQAGDRDGPGRSGLLA